MSDGNEIAQAVGEAVIGTSDDADQAGRAALQAASSEVISEINAERAEIAADLAIAAQLDGGKLDAILGALGRIEGQLSMISQPAPVIASEPVTVIVEGDELPEGGDPVEIVEEVIEEGIEEVEGVGVEVEDAIAAPLGRKKRRGLMSRSRGRG